MNVVITSAARSALTIEVGSLQYAIESQSLQLHCHSIAHVSTT